jgi:hypothetical protein
MSEISEILLGDVGNVGDDVGNVGDDVGNVGDDVGNGDVNIGFFLLLVRTPGM